MVNSRSMGFKLRSNSKLPLQQICNHSVPFIWIGMIAGISLVVGLSIKTLMIPTTSYTDNSDLDLEAVGEAPYEKVNSEVIVTVTEETGLDTFGDRSNLLLTTGLLGLMAVSCAAGSTIMVRYLIRQLVWSPTKPMLKAETFQALPVEAEILSGYSYKSPQQDFMPPASQSTRLSPHCSHPLNALPSTELSTQSNALLPVEARSDNLAALVDLRRRRPVF